MEGKFKDVVDREKVEALWSCFLPSNFYLFIFTSENFPVLNKISLKYQTVAEIVSKFANEGGLLQLKQFLKQNAFIYQFVYSTLFPKYFCRIDDQAIQSRCSFELAFTNYKAQKNGYNINLQLIPNIVKIEDTECNSLTVEVGSNTTDDKVKKPQEKSKRKRKQDDKIKKCKRKKEKLKSDFEINTEKLNSIRKKTFLKKIVRFCNFFNFLKNYER